MFSVEFVTTCSQKVELPKQITLVGLMFSKEDHDFIDMLFGKLTCLTDPEMIDLHDDDTCCDHVEFEIYLIQSKMSLIKTHLLQK